ncbi:hypothetical protein EC988_003089, partial [Linderina pennispora]
QQQQARPRRGTNAARYVPGVGFISDDGISATSPRPSPGVTATFKGPTSGAPSTSGAVTSAAASPAGRITPGSLSVQTAPTGKQTVLTASPGMGESPQQQQQQQLDKESLQQLQSTLGTMTVDAMQQELEALAHPDLVAVATSALVSRNGLMSLTNKWHVSVGNVLQTYETIASQVESFRRLCDAHDEETARLSSLLAQAAQEAQQWHEKYDRVQAELEELKASNAAKERALSEEPPAASVATAASVGAAAVPQAAPSMAMPSPGDGGMMWPDQQQQQQQAWQSFGGAQYPVANTSAAMPAGFMAAQALLPSLLASGQLPANVDYAQLMSVASRIHAAQQQQQQQQGFMGAGVPGFNVGSMLGNSSGLGMSQAQQQQASAGGAGGAGMQTVNPASSVSSSSLLSALNAGSQPF